MLRMLILAPLLSASLVAHGQSIALTFDDGLNPRTEPHAAEWNQAFLAALAKNKAKALLLPAGDRVDSVKGIALVQAWAADGHSIGNHSYSHTNFGSDKVTVESYIADIKKAEALLSRVSRWRMYYRFPYLKEGATAQRRDAVRTWLTDHGYRTAHVSIDTSDWYYSTRLMGWRRANPSASLEGYRTAYLEHLWQRALYYDSLSKKLLGRSAKHVILLHTNAANAFFLNDVIAMFNSRGWTIVDPEEAFADPLYATKTTTLPGGESILWSLAKQAGIEGLRYPAEDEVYEKDAVDRVEAQGSKRTQASIDLPLDLKR